MSSLKLQLLEDLFKNFQIVFGQVGHNFPVQFNVRFLEPVDELGIVRSVLADRGVDLDSPEFAEFALLFFAVGELEAPGVEQGLFGLALFGFARPQKALGVFKESLAALICFYSAFNACHVSDKVPIGREGPFRDTRRRFRNLCLVEN